MVYFGWLAQAALTPTSASAPVTPGGGGEDGQLKAVHPALLRVGGKLRAIRSLHAIKTTGSIRRSKSFDASTVSSGLDLDDFSEHTPLNRRPSMVRWLAQHAQNVQAMV